MNTALVALALLAPTAPPNPAAPDVKETVRTGLKWLAEKQNADGSWVDANPLFPTSDTASAGLALLMEGSTPQTGTYAPQIRKALAWMEKNAQASGRLGGTGQFEVNQYLMGHAQALVFLVCAHDTDEDPERARRVARLIEKGLTFTVECQSSRGGWGYVRARDSSDYDASQSTAEVLQALFAAHKAGFSVPKPALGKAVAYLTRATNRDGGVVSSLYGGYVPRDFDGLPTATTAASASLLMSDGSRPEQLARWVRNANRTVFPQMLNVRAPNSIALFQQCQLARTGFALGESGHHRLDPDAPATDLVKWSAYRPALFKALKDTQNKDGSWPDSFARPIYSTALALIVLQLDNDYLPALSR
jgi:hypothetical protein